MKKENEVIRGRIIRDIRNLFEHKEEDYQVGNFWKNNFFLKWKQW